MLAFLIASAISLPIAWQSVRASLDYERDQVSRLGANFASALESDISRALSATYALAALVRHHRGVPPDFDQVATEMLRQFSGLAALGLAPNGVVGPIVPLKGNERAIGHDLLKDPTRDKEAFLARDTGKLTLAGPFNLIQGGVAAAGRLPIYFDLPGGGSGFWGFASVLIRFPEAAQTTGLHRLAEGNLAYELWRIHPDTRQHVSIAEAGGRLIDPVNLPVTVPNATWTLSIAPTAGWGHPLRTAGKYALAVLFSALMGVLAGLLARDRRHRKSLESRIAEATRDLRHREQEQRTLIGALPDLIMRFDREGRHLFVSENVSEKLDLTAAEMIGKTHRELGFPEASCARWEAEINSVFATGRESESEFAVAGRERMLTFNWRLVPMCSSDGRMDSVLAVIQDVSARKLAEMALETHRQQLEQLVQERTAELSVAKDAAESANRAKSAFLANMSHELRTPMNGVLGMISLVQRRIEDPKGREQLALATESATHLLELINNILDISKIEAQRMVLEEIDFAMGDVFERLEALVGQAATDKGLKLEIVAADDIRNGLFRGDALRLGQVLVNLASNAIKFTDSGTVSIRAARGADAQGKTVLRFDVKDTGIGIAPEELGRLFSAFEQADNSMTRRYGGTGLGLAISKRLVGMMGGEIGVDSEPGKGSNFWFTVRLGKSSIDQIIREAAEEAPELRLMRDWAGTRVLLAEDEPVSQQVASGILARAGILVDLADDGSQALAMAKARPYALILMDMQMPVLNGIDATRAIRADSLNSATPIVALTANAFDEDRRVCLEAGMNAHVAKPIDAPVLYRSVLLHLEQGSGA